MKSLDQKIDAVVKSVLVLLFIVWAVCMIAMPLDLIVRQAWQDHLDHKWSMEHGRGYWARQTAIHNAQIETEIRKHK